MQPASSNDVRSGPSVRRAGPIALLAALAVAAPAALAPVPSTALPAAREGVELRLGVRPATPPLERAGERQLARSSWRGGTHTTATGEFVTVFVSEAYPDADAAGQRWADFFASLLHGQELGGVTVYVVTPTEIAAVCGDQAIGCYGSGRLVIVGEMMFGVPAEEVARHEYGHHVAANRLNAPWPAIDWGPKRWASAAGVCSRVQQRTAFPGDEDQHYFQNPGEAFAEVYRVLNDRKAGAAGVGWQIVDPTFYPDDAALAAAEQDVTQPWGATTGQVAKGRFTTTSKKIWTLALQTPLDGELVASLTLRPGQLYDLTLLAPDGRTVLTRGLWSGVSEKRVSTTVCGQRSLFLRVTRRGAAGPFVLRLVRP